MKQYLDLLKDIVENGSDRDDRTGTGTRSVFGRQIRFDLGEGFPILTTKEVHIKSAIYELLWVLRGDTNVSYLNQNGVTIWDEWANSKGDLGPVYGRQWISFPTPNGRGINQIRRLIEQINENPLSRRLLVCAWNPGELPVEKETPQENVNNGRMALAPCHCLFQFYIDGNKLSCQLYQRSADYFLGVPFNIVSYSLLTHMIAQQCDLEVGDFVHTFGDCHIYLNHLTEAIVYKQLERDPKPLPRLELLRKPNSIFDYQFKDFQLLGYNPYSAIRAPISV